jgi:hypothetical protein
MVFLKLKPDQYPTGIWFIGLVRESVTNHIHAGTNYLGSALPVAGLISADLHYTNATARDLLIKWDPTNQVPEIFANDGGSSWSPERTIHRHGGRIYPPLSDKSRMDSDLFTLLWQLGENDHEPETKATSNEELVGRSRSRGFDACNNKLPGGPNMDKSRHFEFTLQPDCLLRRWHHNVCVRRSAVIHFNQFRGVLDFESIFRRFLRGSLLRRRQQSICGSQQI